MTRAARTGGSRRALPGTDQGSTLPGQSPVAVIDADRVRSVTFYFADGYVCSVCEEATSLTLIGHRISRPAGKRPLKCTRALDR